MSRSKSDSGFWAGGFGVYVDELKREYRAKLARLQSQLNDCASETESAAVHAEIAAAKQKFKQNLRDAGRSLF